MSRCLYCNEPAEVKDHVVPRSYLTNRRKSSDGYPHWTVPACRECNALLGSSMFPTMKDRMEFLLGRLRRAKAQPNRTRFLARVIDLQKVSA